MSASSSLELSLNDNEKESSIVLDTKKDHDDDEAAVEQDEKKRKTETKRRSTTAIIKSPTKSHAVTVCIVPPPPNVNDDDDDVSNNRRHVWNTLSSMRQRLKDPGYYRWPPHANLLYPFVELESKQHEEGEEEAPPPFEEEEPQPTQYIQEIVSKLQQAVHRSCPGGPFTVTLNQFGTFGGHKRGVLWLDPQPSRCENDEQLQTLYRAVLEEFPMCNGDQKTNRPGGTLFTPHMTLSHFDTKDGAVDGQHVLEQEYGPLNLSFLLDRIYLLERNGDEGQFYRVAEIAMTKTNATGGVKTRIYDPPEPFPDMPQNEEEWVKEERMKMKQRRRRKNNNKNNNTWGNRRRRSSSSNTGRRTPRIPDTPEVIAAKRAERKAKREASAITTTTTTKI